MHTVHFRAFALFLFAGLCLTIPLPVLLYELFLRVHHTVWNLSIDLVIKLEISNPIICASTIGSNGILGNNATSILGEVGNIRFHDVHVEWFTWLTFQ